MHRRLRAPLIACCMAAFACGMAAAWGQEPNPQAMEAQVQKLTEAMTKAQAQVEESQRQLEEIRAQLAVLRRQMSANGAHGADAASAEAGSAASDPAPAGDVKDTASQLAAAVDEIREHQAVQDAQIATHEQAKVSSESRYPVEINGLMLFTGFVNTSKVDMPSTPTIALPGSGSTGATVKQTILGITAHGPNWAGARSFADIRVDFAGAAGQGSGTYSGAYDGDGSLIRLRTAHAALQWQRAQAFFSLDRPIVSPDSPTSLTAVAEPPMAWSGSLWTWNPQLGFQYDAGLGRRSNLRLQTALIDVGDAPWPTPPTNQMPGTPASYGEHSRWPGIEGRVALLGSNRGEDGNHFGVGGFFAPHKIGSIESFDTWAATLDGRVALPGRFQVSANSYRGQALGGLGAGAYKDFVYVVDADGHLYFQSLDDTGGWVQLKQRPSSRFEWNAAFGLDEVFAKELRPYAMPGGWSYQNLAANRTFTGNFIYSPSAYLLFSIEYRRLMSSPIIGPAAESNVLGFAAGYKF